MKLDWKIAGALLWLGFTVALAIWWLIFGLRQVEILRDLKHSNASTLSRNQRMIVWEGSILTILLAAGGMSLIYYIRLERKRSEAIREFLGAFSHELKTSMASLRLQAESLQEDLATSTSLPLLRRLVKDTVRLELQLENSLFLAQEAKLHLLMEKVALDTLVHWIQVQWPDLKIEVRGKGDIFGDRRALESVLKNLVQNAVIHGKASAVSFSLQAASAGRVMLEITDNGGGFMGERSKLGNLFFRHTTRSGSGLGLYIVARLLEKMEGSLEFPPVTQGFHCRLSLKGEIS